MFINFNYKDTSQLSSVSKCASSLLASRSRRSIVAPEDRWTGSVALSYSHPLVSNSTYKARCSLGLDLSLAAKH